MYIDREDFWNTFETKQEAKDSIWSDTTDYEFAQEILDEYGIDYFLDKIVRFNMVYTIFEDEMMNIVDRIFFERFYEKEEEDNEE